MSFVLTIGLMLQAPPPVVVPRPVPLRSWSQSDPFRQAGRARVVIAGRDAEARLLLGSARGAIDLRYDDGERVALPITSVHNLLAILADRRFGEFWPALNEWAGDDLVAYRDRLVADARTGVEFGSSPDFMRGTNVSLSNGRARATLVEAAVLAESGRREEAIERTREWIEAMSVTDSTDSFDFANALTRLATIQAAGGDPDGAIRTLTVDRATRRRIGPNYAINLDVNRAALLAEAGRADEALATIEAAAAATAAFQEDENSYEVAGGNREFAWIKACALHLLGRDAEAATILRPVLARREVVDDYAVTPASNTLRVRAYACMHDAEGLGEELVRQLKEGAPASGAGLLAQPVESARRTEALYRRVRADPRVVSALAENHRTLPPELHPALRRWAATPPLDAPAVAR